MNQVRLGVLALAAFDLVFLGTRLRACPNSVARLFVVTVILSIASALIWAISPTRRNATVSGSFILFVTIAALWHDGLGWLVSHPLDGWVLLPFIALSLILLAAASATPKRVA